MEQRVKELEHAMKTIVATQMTEKRVIEIARQAPYMDVDERIERLRREWK